MQNLQEELTILKSETGHVDVVKNENLALVQRLEAAQNDLEASLEECARLGDDLKRQQSLYNELKKMRGRGEEIDLLQQVEQV